jgi:hypothetical protein
MRDYLYDEVAKVAYDLHEKRGKVHGYDLDDWLEAERIVLERYAKRMEEEAKKPSKTKAKKGMATGSIIET